MTASTASRRECARTKTAVHFFLEGGFLVRGTLDPHTALKLAVEEADAYQLGYCCEMAQRPDDDSDEPDPECIRDLGDLCHALIANAKPGLYRIVPSPPDNDEYGWFMWGANKRGPGVFEGVVFW